MRFNVGMRATTIRFSDDLWELLERETERQGGSAARFIREAVQMRLVLEAERRGDDGAAAAAREASGGRKPAADPVGAVSDRRRVAAVREMDRAIQRFTAGRALDRQVALAAKILRTPSAAVSLVDRDRQVFKSQQGLPEPWATLGETPLSHSFCQYAVATGRSFVVDDAREHPLLRSSPAIGDLRAIAYAGAPLRTPDGHILGTLCVIDDRPRQWTQEQVSILEALAEATVTELQLQAHRSRSELT